MICRLISLRFLVGLEGLFIRQVRLGLFLLSHLLALTYLMGLAFQVRLLVLVAPEHPIAKS